MAGEEEVAKRLYALPPEEFTATRDDIALKVRHGGDPALARRIKALRKPTTAAWLANQLTNQHPELMRQFADLGRSLRDAQEHLEGEQLRALLAQRHQLVAALVSQARQDAQAAGHRIGDGPEQELTNTLHTALADENAAGLLLGGRLATALNPGAAPPLTSASLARRTSGLPPAAGEEPEHGRLAPVAKTRTDSRPTKPTAQERRLERLRQQAEQLNAQAAEAQDTAERAEAEAEELEHRADTAEFDLAQAREHQEQAARDVREAESALKQARVVLQRAEAQSNAAGSAAAAAKEAADAAAERGRRARAGADALAAKAAALTSRIESQG